MGYCACRRPCRCRSEGAPLSPILLILLVVAILMTLPWLFSYPSVIEVVETPKFQINWALIIAPLLLLFLVHWLSSADPPRKPCPMPPPPPSWGCSCRGKHACACARFNECERCNAILEASVSALLHCLPTNDSDMKVRNGSFSLEVEEGVKCAYCLRRIYEEIRHQKDVLGRHCSQLLSSYICVYSGYGPLKTSIKREIDEALRPGVCSLIDSCSEDDLQYLHTVFGEGPCRNTLATLQHGYKLNFQYEGKV